MASCNQCQKVLQGSWNVTESGVTYQRTGRYLGIPDGYFLYSGNPNWVYCYCLTCWEKQVLALPFVQTAIQKATAEQIAQTVSSVNGWNQFSQNLVQQISASVTNGQNQTTQVISSLTSTINSNQQNIKTKIQECLNYQNNEVQFLISNGISQQFSNQQIKTQLSGFIEQTITKIYKADQEIVKKEIENKIDSINKSQCETILQLLDQTAKQNSQNYSLMIEQKINNHLILGQTLQCQGEEERVQIKQLDQSNQKQLYESKVCRLIQNLNKCIVDSQTICKIYQNDEGKSTNILQGIWQELEISLVEKIQSSLNKIVEHIQLNYNRAINQVELIVKARDQFLEHLKAIGIQDQVDQEGHIKIFQHDIQKYCKEDLYNLLNSLKELQQSDKN